MRAAINIDPHTAALTVTSDPLPTALDGIPLQLKVVNVTIDRPGFTFNPTSCAKTAITGTLSSKESGGAHVSSPFQVTNCAGLGFKPEFKVSTSGKTSRANGASLDAKVIYPTGAKYANIAKVKVDLPKQLPSRLDDTAEGVSGGDVQREPGSVPEGLGRRDREGDHADPAGAVDWTGIFRQSWRGSVPEPDRDPPGLRRARRPRRRHVHQQSGDHQQHVQPGPGRPDQRFELYLPEGRDSALAANGNLCKSTLKMPTSFIAQNGATIHQSTPIAVTGCSTKSGKAGKARKARVARKRRTHNGTPGGVHRGNAGDRRGK